MEKTSAEPSRKVVYQGGGGPNARIHPPVIILQSGDEIVWENLTDRTVEFYFPGGGRYLTDPSPLRVHAGDTSTPKQIEVMEPGHRRAYAYRAVQIGEDRQPDMDVHGNSHPIIIIR
jgi:hypothetical protein